MANSNWKKVRATSFVDALRLCKDFAMATKNMSVARIANAMGKEEHSLYKWLSNGTIPGILVPTYELVCGCNYVTDWYATTANRLVVPMPKGRKASEQDLHQISSGCTSAVAQLSAFYKDPMGCDTEALLAAIRQHMEEFAYHHNKVARYSEPELEFGS